MNNNCEYAGDRCCLCSACQSMRKALEDADKMTAEEINQFFQKATEIPEEEGGAGKD